MSTPSCFAPAILLASLLAAAPYARADGPYTVTSVSSGMHLDVDGAGVADGNKILMWQASGQSSQEWTFWPQSDGTFAIYNAHSNKVLDVYNGYGTDGALVQQWTWWGGSNQRWNLVPVGDTNYQIINAKSGKCLDAWIGYNTNGCGLQQWDCHGTDNQLWALTAQPRGPGCTLATAGGNTLVNKVALPQPGWAPAAQKIAVLSTTQQVAPPSFNLLLGGQSVLQGQATAGGNRWGLFTKTIDLSRVTGEGVYTLQVQGAPDSCMEISRSAYSQLRSGSNATLGMTELLLGFFEAQRCGTPTDLLANPVDTDTNLPLYVINSGGSVTRVPGQSGDVSGGWHDATSTDKELVTISRALENFAYAYMTSGITADRAALLDEIQWGVAYLVKTQNADGSWYLSVRPSDPWDPNSPPRRLEINIDTGSTARAGAALAAVAQATQPLQPALAAQATHAAEAAYAWVLANPNHFVGDDVVQASHHGNATGVLDLAVNITLLEPGPQHEAYVNDLILSGSIVAGLWSANVGRFFGQQSWYGVEDSQAIVPLLHYYPVAPPQVQQAIVRQASNWLTFLQTQQDPVWGMDQAMIVSWFGGNGTLVDNAVGMLLIYQTLGWPQALSYAQNNLDWVWGRNPYGTSFVPGVGHDLGVAPFARTVAASLGAVLPGMLTTADNELTLATDEPWDEWQVGEATIDSSSALLWALSMLQAIY